MRGVLSVLFEQQRDTTEKTRTAGYAAVGSGGHIAVWGEDLT
jgi:hypothetical protein